MANRHWYYPSAIIGCGLTIDELRSEELTCLRSEVTCPGCLSRLQADKEICEACKLSASKVDGVRQAPPHVCDPTLA